MPNTGPTTWRARLRNSCNTTIAQQDRRRAAGRQLLIT
jgi:hypothetical protein